MSHCYHKTSYIGKLFSSVSNDWLWAERLRFGAQQEWISLCPCTFMLALWPAHRALYQGLKRPEDEGGHLPLSSAKIKGFWSFCYTVSNAPS